MSLKINQIEKIDFKFKNLFILKLIYAQKNTRTQ